MKERKPVFYVEKGYKNKRYAYKRKENNSF